MSDAAKRGPGRPRKVSLETLLATFAAFQQVSVPILVETLELNPNTAYATIKRAMRSQWVTRIEHGTYVLTTKGEKKAETLGV